jgi:hypothetical protein
MKTLKTISFLFLFAAFATAAMANSTLNKYIGTTDDLKKAIKDKVESDFTQPINFLNEMGVNKLQENVEIIFFITPEQTLRILSVDCKNSVAAEYVKRLFNKEKLNVDGLLTGKMYKIDLMLVYKAA